MKLTEKQFNILQIIILGYPLVLIIIPRILGYIFYSPLNNFWLIGGMGVILGLINFIKYPKYLHVFGLMTLVSVIPYMILSTSNFLGARAEISTLEDRVERAQRYEELYEIEPPDSFCEIDLYVEDSVGGGGLTVLSLSTGGGTYVDSFIPFYKRGFEESDCN